MVLTESNFGVVILCPDLNSGGLRYTSNSIKSYFPKVNYITVVGNNAMQSDIDLLSKYGNVCKGGKTITSLMDKGLKELKSEWCLVVTSGSMVKYSTYKKYRIFSEDRDIVFPVINKKYLFHEASINGILMKKKTYEDVGMFGDEYEDIKEAKLMWAVKAIDKNYKFKALVGARFS